VKSVQLNAVMVLFFLPAILTFITAPAITALTTTFGQSNESRWVGLAVLLLLTTGACQPYHRRLARAFPPKPIALEEDNRFARALSFDHRAACAKSKILRGAGHIDEFERLYGKLPRSKKTSRRYWFELKNLANAEREYSALARGPLAAYGAHGLGRVEGARGNWAIASHPSPVRPSRSTDEYRILADLGAALLQIGEIDDAKIAMRRGARAFATWTRT